MALACGAACLVDNPGFSASDGASGSGSSSEGGSAGAGSGGESEGASSGASMSEGATDTSAVSSSSSEPTSEVTSGDATSEATTSGDSTGDAVTTEAPDPGPPSLCNMPIGQWKIGAPEAVLLNFDAHQYDPVMLSDGQTLFFSSSGSSHRLLRKAFGEPFMGLPMLNTSLNTIFDESKVMLSQDRLRAYIASDRPPAGPGNVDIFVASRESDVEPFAPATWIAELATPDNELDVQLSADELRVYYARRVNNQLDLYFAARAGLEAPFVGIVPIAELNLPDGPEASPSLSLDERTIFFTSQRAGDLALNIYVAVRDDPGGVFQDAAPVAGLDGPGVQAEPFLVEREEGCELFFVDDTKDQMTWQIYRAPIVAM